MIRGSCPRPARRHFRIRQQFLLEILPLLPDLHGVFLHQPVGVLPGNAGLGQVQQDLLGKDQPLHLVQVPQHVFGVDHQVPDEAVQPAQGEVQGHRGVRGDVALHRGVGDVPLVPERHVFQGRDAHGADVAGLAGEVLGEDRVALVGHGRRPLLPLAEQLLRLQHLGPLQVADLHGDPLHGGGDDGEGAEILGMAVTGDDLGRDRLRFQPHFGADVLFHERIDVGKGADRAGDGAGGDILAGPRPAGAVALHLGIQGGQLEAEGDRLGVDAVGAAHADRILVLDRPGP